MKKISYAKLHEMLEDHEKWLNDPETGNKASFFNTDLRDKNLSSCDLRHASFVRADLTDADLYRTDLRNADFTHANLRNTDLRQADLRGAELDFSCLPLWCGGLNFKIDERQARQIMYHALSLCHEFVEPTPQLRRWVNKFHHVGSDELLKLKP